MKAAERLKRRIDTHQRGRPWLAFPVAVWKKFSDDQAGNLAALLAYFAFVSIFPLLLVLVTVLGIVLRSDPALQHKLLNSALAEFPVIGQQLRPKSLAGSESGVALAIGIIGTFLGARGVANAAQNAFNAVWAVPMRDRPGFPYSLLRSVALTLVVGIGLIATTVLSSLAGGVGNTITGPAGAVAAVAVSLVFNFGVFWLGFWLGTAKAIGFRDLLLGAILTAIVWQILQTVGGYFVSHQLSHASSLYGTFGIVLGLIAWLYLQAEAAIYALEASMVHARKLWPRSIFPPPLTAEDRQAYKMYAEREERHPEEQIEVETEEEPHPS